MQECKNLLKLAGASKHLFVVIVFPNTNCFVNCQSSTLTPITGTASVCFAEKEPARRVAERGLLVFPSSSQLEQVFPTN